ncbi:hypothetical protein [Cereibacter sphaeroides]|uniref:hypothetical protein n=1 Tax=Cereibacter sphaeroides TaxID=1063 RepID=UPI001F3AB5E7|nr:hypothetical protein [Cereibacter sphaeroides]
MRRMLAEAGIVADAAEGTCDGWETFDAAAAQPILDDLTALTHRNMSPNKATHSEGRALRELKERARVIANDDPLLGAKRGGRVTVSLDWPQAGPSGNTSTPTSGSAGIPWCCWIGDHMKRAEGGKKIASE